ncbi:MAG TPA: hypothetical protein PKY05_12350, partial [Fibrobacteria bacterium]|nr:hypothetical protein [Fibrobacteria bacterium]
LFLPDPFVQGFGLEPSNATRILARRASMFMLGISVACLAMRSLQDAPWRGRFCLAMGITLLGLAGTSSFELARGTVDSSVFFAATVETILGLAFASTWIHDQFVHPATPHRGEI